MKQAMLRVLLLAVLIPVLCGLLCLSASADETDLEAVTMPDAYGDLEGILPPEVTELLPQGLFSRDAGEALDATREMSEWSYLLQALLDAVGLRLHDAVGLLCALLGLILIAAVLGKLKESLGSASGDIWGFCIRLALYTAIVLQTAGTVELLQGFFSQLNALMGGMIPVMGILYALGGNLGQAAVSGELTVVLLAVCEYVSATVTPPVCAVCLSFSLMDAVGLRLTLSHLCDQIKRWYVGLLGLVMFLLSLALSAQSVLAGRADTLGMKGIKYAVGNMIPVVGGAVAGSLGTVAAGVSLIRGVCGVSGIILIALLLIPVLVQLLLFRAVLRLAATVSALLGCDGETRLLGEMASLHGYLAAAASICSLTFVLSLALLIHTTSAIG